MRLVLYLMILSSFLAADLFSINIKIMELSIFRISLLGLIIVTLLKHIKINAKFTFKLKNTQSIIILFYFIWFLSSLFSIAWVKDYYSWLRAIYFIGSGFLCIWLLSTYLKKQKDFRTVLMIMQSMIILHNIIGWSELLTGSYKFIDLSKIDRYGQFGSNPATRVPVSMFANPNDYATLLVFGVFISYIVFLNSNNKKSKILSLSSIISSTLLILQSNSRANILGLIIGVIILIYIKYFRKISIGTVIIIIAIPIVLLFNSQIISNILMKISNQLQFNFGGSSGSDYTRLNLIKNGLYFLKQTIGFGTGPGNIEYWMATEKIYYVGNIRNMHNWWIEILVGSGVFVFIAYIVIYFKMAKILYCSHLKSENKFIKNTSSGLIAIMAAFVISSVSTSSNMSAEWLWLFWGVVIAYIGYVEKHNNALRNN